MSNHPHFHLWCGWSRVASAAMFGTFAVVLVAHFVAPAVLSLDAVQHVGIGLLGLLTIIVSIEAVRAGYFPGSGVYKGMYRSTNPFQFWVAVVLFGLVFSSGCIAFGLSPLFGLPGSHG